MRRLLVLLVFLLCFTGCLTGRTFELDPKWKPLVSVEEATDKIMPPQTTTTIGEHCYVSDLAQWLKDYPPGSIQQEALLRHEQLHAIRQLSYPLGIETWLLKYISEPSFRWEEEKLGYEQEITWLVQHGVYVYPPLWASYMSNNYSSMVSFEDAQAWVEATIRKAQGN
jgi:hypothetical protein